jgi:hypothetical protein
MLMGKATDQLQRWTRQAAAVGLGLSALALVTGNLGNLSRALDGTLAVTGLSALTLLLLPSPRRSSLPRLTLALIIMLAALPVVARGEPWGLLGAAVFFFALAHTEGDEAGIVDALLLSALLFTVYRLCVAYVPALWHAEQWSSIYFSWFVGVGLMLGPTALGTPILFLFVLFALSTFLLTVRPSPPSAPLGPGKRRAFLIFGGWLVALVLAAVAYIWLQPPLGSWLLTHWPAPAFPTSNTPQLETLTYLEWPLLLFVLCWLVSVPAVLVLQPRPLSFSPTTPRRRWLAAGLCLLAVSYVVLTLDPPHQPQRGTILFHDTGHIDWGRPAFGRYGAHSGGSFGLLPNYLAAYGYEVRSGPLTTENLEGARAVVLLSLPESLEPGEKERLLAFVEAGGGLIIWGEHTGLGRIREPTNDLLASLPGAPIRLKFDSAVPVRQGWAEGLTLLPHPVVYGVRDPLDLVIAVGASLEISPPARPIIVGRFGHSDAGDETNQARNYVGDMRYNPGERLGDVVLAAGVRYGLGHIVVLGDTTPLGSVNLMTTMPFQARLLDWVTARSASGWRLVMRNGWLAGLLLLAAAACLFRAPSRITLVGAALILGLTLALIGYVNDAQAAPPVPAGPIAYVDMSHQERFDRLLWEDTSIGGLDYNLVRNGTLPLLLHKVDSKMLASAELLLVIAPGQPFSAREIQTISSWVKNGGHLLVSAGWEESEASVPLLAAFGLEVGNIPLGPAEAERETGLVRFHEAWPVTAQYEDAETIVAAYSYPVAVYQPWGKGGVALIGDSQFLLGSTLEGETTYQEGNILLLRDIVQNYLGVAERKPVFSEKTSFYGWLGCEP